ncbi:MAG: glycosyltransferase family 2 protein [Candidatus Saccharimonadales bacterium]
MNQTLHEVINHFESDFNEIVFITDKPELVKKMYLDKPIEILIACSRWQLLLSRQKFLKVPENNVKLISMRHLSKSFMKDKLLICADYIETKSIVAFFSRRLRLALRSAHLSFTVANKNWFWRSITLRRLTGSSDQNLVGYVPDERDKLIAVGGIDASIDRLKYPSLKVLAIIAQYNEIDIIGATVRHLLNQGVDVHIIDNWSDDGSYELLQELAKQNYGRVFCERFPNANRHKYEWGRLLTHITDIAKGKANRYEWIIFNDADEIRWSPWANVTLQQAISFIDSRGYNCIDYTVFNFHPTKDGFTRNLDPLDFFHYGEFGTENWYFLQLKTWKNNPQAELASTGGHLVNFPGRKVFPLKFLLGHYSLRSSAQAAKKIFKDRQPRYITEERKKGWHVQYNSASGDQGFIYGKKGLIDFKDPDFWKRNLLQRLFGAGIK